MPAVTPRGPSGLDHIDTWIFDLDNTLYPASCRLFDQVDELIAEFIVDLLGVMWLKRRHRGASIVKRC